MTRKTWLDGTFTVLLCLGALAAIVGGGTIAVLLAFEPSSTWLPNLMQSYAAAMAGFLMLGIMGLLAAAIGALLREPAAARPPAPILPVRPKTVRRPAKAEADIKTLYNQVKTYIDLEMWELAYDKAQLIIKKHPESDEAKKLNRNINELRWKAEPKFLSEDGVSKDDERELVEKGLQGMLEHVRTYMELEMWELARQKAMAIMKSFPDAAQTDEIARLYPEIDKKYRESSDSGMAPAVPAGGNEEKAEESKDEES